MQARSSGEPKEPHLVGRAAELERLRAFARAAAGGAGRLVLLSGEAGAGKTSLAEAALADLALRRIQAPASPLAAAPFAPLAAAFGELGIAWPSAPDAAALSASVCRLLCAAAETVPIALVLDDLQWGDHATLELLPLLAERSREASLLVLAIYSADGLARAHPMRIVRDALRRSRRLDEVELGPLDEEGVRELAERGVGRAVEPALAKRLLAASGGVPFFVEALAAAPAGLRAAEGLAIPQALRDAVLARFDRLSAAGRAAADAGAVLGTEFDLSAAAALVDGDAGVGELLESGLARERPAGRAAFTPALVREALYEAIAWTRRRALHRAAAQILEAAGRQLEQAAEHWRAAGEPACAQRAWLSAARRSRELHAHRDAAEQLQRALDLWQPGQDEPGRLTALDQLGDSAQLAGQNSQAFKVWHEIAECAGPEARMHRARALRRIANLHELNCDWERLIAVRMHAQRAFADAGAPGEAVLEAITTAGRLRQSSRHAAALEVLAGADESARAAGRRDLQVRINALRASLQVRLGDSTRITAIEEALSEAIEMDLPALAGEIYQRLGDALERRSDFAQATQVNLAGIAFCEARSAPGVGACLTCMSWILVRSGAWDQAMSASRRLVEMPAPFARGAGISFVGLVHVLRGEARKAEGPLLEAIAVARRIDHSVMAVNTTWGLALHAALNANAGAAAQHCRAILSLVRDSDERHACIPSLRWSAGLLRSVGDAEGLAACVEALGESAVRFASPEPLSALAHAMGELAWQHGDLARAAEQFEHAVTLLADAQLPRERVESELRAAAARAALGARDAAVAHARSAAKGAERLGARPLAEAAAQQLRDLGEALAGALGPRGSRRAERGGLTARQLEVLAAISTGLTDKEVARRLALSPRTVESHVATALAVLDARSRAEAVRKAAERGLLRAPAKPQ
jgi:DNA-binding NarL/FixJ family response regulator